jgi:hypothetical protein
MTKPATSRLRQRFAAIWGVLRYALGPAAKHGGRIFGWWPVVASILAIGTPLAGLLTAAPMAWLIAGGLAILFALLLRAAAHFYSQVNPGFPRHMLNVDRLWYADFENLPHETKEVRLLFLPITFTNREPSRRLSLQLDLLWQRGEGELSMGPYRLSHYRGKLSGDVLVPPVAVDPETTVTGDLIFTGDLAFGLEYGDLVEVYVKPHYDMILRVTDHVTGATMETPVPLRTRDEARG